MGSIRFACFSYEQLNGVVGCEGGVLSKLCRTFHFVPHRSTVTLPTSWNRAYEISLELFIVQEWIKVQVKGKVVPVLYLSTTPWRRIGEWRYRSMHSSALALGGGEWSASRSGRFTPREIAPGTHWIGGWVGPRAILDSVVKRKIPIPRRESNPRTPSSP
jgi:hypothetical protein